MNNWQYGGDEPTSPWRSAMSVPRQPGLRRTSEGIRLVQQPVREMERLRDRHVSFKGGDMAAANAWLAQNQIAGQQLELLVELAPQTGGVQGVKVLQGPGCETVIGVDRRRGQVFVDRTKSGNVDFNPQFSGVQVAPLPGIAGNVKLHIFVDASSVEVFVNDGERVFTDLVFPSSDSRGVAFFQSESDARVRSAQVWTLKSVWK